MEIANIEIVGIVKLYVTDPWRRRTHERTCFRSLNTEYRSSDTRQINNLHPVLRTFRWLLKNITYPSLLL